MNHTDEKYQRWIEYRKRRKESPMTNTQWRFAMWLFEQEDTLMAIGDMTSIFESVRSFVKEDYKPEEDV